MNTVEAQPYPWPWDGDLSPSGLAVVVAGGQRHWLDRTIDPGPHLRNVTTMLTRVRTIGVPVLLLRHGTLEAGSHRLPLRGSDGFGLVSPCDVGDIVVDAPGLDGCYGSALDRTLRRLHRTRVVLCGLGLEGPVHSTLRSLNDRGYECLTLTDATAPCDPVTAAPALSTITFSFGIFGAVASTAALLEALALEAHTT